jgi:small subunit ribosomal protein S18
VCVFCKDHTVWVDYKDVNLLRRFMSDRGKIRARRVTGNCAQHQRDVQVAIKTARELALLPYAQRTVSERGPGRGGRSGGRRDGERPDRGTPAAETDEADVPDADLEEVDA